MHELRTGNKGNKFVISRPGYCSINPCNSNSGILGGQLMNAFLFFSFVLNIQRKQETNKRGTFFKEV